MKSKWKEFPQASTDVNAENISCIVKGADAQYVVLRECGGKVISVYDPVDAFPVIVNGDPGKEFSEICRKYDNYR